jgi:hypothetical protein
MTVDKAFKRAVRKRMQHTGEKYTEARRAVAGATGGSGAADPADPIAVALRPGRVVGIVCGGGFVNLSLVMPYLIAFEDRGHHLTYVISEREGLLEVPSPFDFICARGFARTEQIAETLAGTDEDTNELEALMLSLPNASSTHGPMPDAAWRRHLREKAQPGKAAVLWVEDVQVGPPLARGGEGGFDGIEAQLDGLRRLAVETESIITVGHCMPAHYPDGWEVIVNGVDETFVISSKDTLGDEEFEEDSDGSAVDGGRLIEHHGRNMPSYRISCDIDTRFGDWRSLYLERRWERQKQR